MRTWLYLALLFSQINVNNFEESSPLMLSHSQCACRGTSPETYEDALVFNFGGHNGQCVDSCRFRKAVILNPDKHVYANILHDGKYWVAKVPVDKTIGLQVGFERFLSRISHVVLRFRFDPKFPVELTEVDHPENHTRIQDLVLSAEGVPPRGEEYSFVASATGQYPLIYRFLSVQDALKWMIETKHHSVQQFQLQVSSLERQRILIEGFRRSASLSFRFKYHLMTNNCATSALDLIRTRQPLAPSLIRDLQGAIPVSLDSPFFGTLASLEQMGVMGNALPNLEQEFRTHEKESSPDSNN